MATSTSTRLHPVGTDVDQYERFIAKLARQLRRAGDANPEQSAREIAVMYAHHFRTWTPAG